MFTLARMFDEATSIEDYAQRYVARLSRLLAELDTSAVARIIETMDQATENGKTYYFIANGGSAAVASHWVNDLVAGGYTEGVKPFKAFCLSDNVEAVTAIGNDSGYENIFSYQLRTCLQPGDVVYAMSVSGNSENIIRAVDYAKEVGATSIGLCGFEGGRLKDHADIVLHIPTEPDEYGPVEDIFAIMDHIVTGYLTMKRGKRLNH
ncbi:MAG: SIS domain-containing protein [Candidatus Hydrogenedentes bacterium]|nr:SIS domain-containing protein [Candidatus Hydrogenedentota bacterium]